MSESEFSRPIRADTIGTVARQIQVAAEPAERERLARRFDLCGIDTLAADLSVVRSNQDVIASGRLTAQVVQNCVVSGEPVPAHIDEPFEILFRLPPAGVSNADEEIELGASEMDVMFYDGASVDVAEAIAQTMALALDPYPRAPAAAEALQEAGVKDESEAGPFGALAGLKDKLAK